mmetsp:Transcript_812/g.2500  ORF Transcript_812/g.2500 Transcript_812/m.2500 type:complete len:379 (+) Transcript_812:8-1144(+)
MMFYNASTAHAWGAARSEAPMMNVRARAPSARSTPGAASARATANSPRVIAPTMNTTTMSWSLGFGALATLVMSEPRRPMAPETMDALAPAAFLSNPPSEPATREKFAATPWSSRLVLTRAMTSTMFGTGIPLAYKDRDSVVLSAPRAALAPASRANATSTASRMIRVASATFSSSSSSSYLILFWFVSGDGTSPHPSSPLSSSSSPHPSSSSHPSFDARGGVAGSLARPRTARSVSNASRTPGAIVMSCGTCASTSSALVAMRTLMNASRMAALEAASNASATTAPVARGSMPPRAHAFASTASTCAASTSANASSGCPTAVPPEAYIIFKICVVTSRTRPEPPSAAAAVSRCNAMICLVDFNSLAFVKLASVSLAR